MYPLSSFACHPEQSRGRLYKEDESPTRTCYQRDRDRIIHSTAFRRLEYKTQVFVTHEGDHYRTRLTHSLEVSQMARSICRNLGLNEDLGEAIALAHDLGHTPFGHAGEDALNAALGEYGSFSHNGHAIKLVTQLEQKYAEFDGLNLTWETLEGIAKHNGPLVEKVPEAIEYFNQQYDLHLHEHASAEAQAAAIADDIAYNNHDLDDGLRAGLFTIDALLELPLIGSKFREVKALYGEVPEARWVHEAIRRVITSMIIDVVGQTRENISNLAIESVEDIRQCGKQIVHFSPEMEANHQALKAFLHENMYRHAMVNQMTGRAQEIVSGLFNRIFLDIKWLPVEWGRHVNPENLPQKSRIIADYIAGMTDRYASDLFKKMQEN